MNVGLSCTRDGLGVGVCDEATLQVVTSLALQMAFIRHARALAEAVLSNAAGS